jgi:hypothetical protein
MPETCFPHWTGNDPQHSARPSRQRLAVTVMRLLGEAAAAVAAAAAGAVAAATAVAAVTTVVAPLAEVAVERLLSDHLEWFRSQRQFLRQQLLQQQPHQRHHQRQRQQ